MKPLRVGVIGLGIGMQHAKAVLTHPCAELAAVCDIDPAKRELAREALPGVACLAKAEELIGLGLDVVSIASFDDAHFEQARQAIAVGSHLYIEKPLCLHEAETRALAALMRDNRELRLSSNLVLRTCPRFLRVKEEMDAGGFGQVYHIEADYLWGRIAKLTDGWRARMQAYSIILGASVHMIDMALWLTGERPVSVVAMGSSFATRGTAQRHDDFSLLLLRFASGRTVKVAAHGGCVHPHFHRLAVYGTKRTFAGELPGAYWVNSSDPAVPPVDEPAAYPGREQRRQSLWSFLDLLFGKREKALVDEADVFASMSVCHAAQMSAANGCEWPVDYFYEE